MAAGGFSNFACSSASGAAPVELARATPHTRHQLYAGCPQ